MRFQLSNPNCCRPRLPKPHCDCPWASVCHWPGQSMGTWCIHATAVNVEIEWKWLKLHVSYINSNIRNLQFLEPHLFIFYWHDHDPIRVIQAGLDWLCPGFYGWRVPFIGGLQQDTLEVTYDSKHCWAMAPTRAQGLLIDLWMTPLVTPLVICFTKKKEVTVSDTIMLTKRSGGWVDGS